MKVLAVVAFAVLHATAFAQPGSGPAPKEGAPPAGNPPTGNAPTDGNVPPADKPAAAPATPAEQAFLDGRTLIDEGKPAEACAKFEESIKLDPSATGTLLNLGLCNERLGRTATALAWFRKAQFRAAEMGMADYEEVAKTHTFMLAVRVPTIKITFSSPPPAGSGVFVDNRQVSDLEIGNIELDAGTHVIELRGAVEPVRTPINLKDGDQDIVVQLVVPVPVVEKVYVDVDRGRPHRIVAYSLAGAGLVLWGASIAVSLSAKDKSESSELPDDRHDAQQLARFGGTGLFIAGTAAIAAGVFVYLRAPGVERVERTAIAPAVGADQVGLVVRGAW